MVEVTTRVDSSPSLKYGSYTIHSSGNLLLLFFRGTWSDKCAADYVRDVSRYRHEKGLHHFASIAIISEWQLGTPDAINMVSNVIKRGAQTGMAAQFLLSEGNNHLSLQIARQNVEKAFPGTISGKALEDFIPELERNNIAYDEGRVRAILASNGRCD